MRILKTHIYTGRGEKGFLLPVKLILLNSILLDTVVVRNNVLCFENSLPLQRRHVSDFAVPFAIFNHPKDIRIMTKYFPTIQQNSSVMSLPKMETWHGENGETLDFFFLDVLLI